MPTRTLYRAVAFGLILTVSYGGLTCAEEPQMPAPGALEEIVVTSQRRSESLQSVPIAITALSQAAIEKADIHDLTHLAVRVPGLTFSPFSPGQNIVSLRGVSSNDDGAGTDNSVAVFVDDVYLGRVSNINPEMFDVERVEVLRGPQGTLYGKNTVGGAINVISSPPSRTGLDAKFRVDLGNYQRRDFAGLLSGPLSETWAGKLSFSTRQHDGWVDNVVLGKKERNDNTKAFRGQLLHASEGSELLLSADYGTLDVEDMARIPLTQVAGSLGPLVDQYRALCGDRRPKCATNPSDGFADRTAWGVSAKYTQPIGDAQLVSITAYRRSHIDWAMDSIGVAIPLTDLIDDATNQFSQELRWVSSPDRPLKYVAGLWFLRENTNRFEVFDIGSNGDIDASDRYRQINHTTGYAGFGQADWRVRDRWVLTLGGRYSYETKRIANDAHDGDFVVINQTFANQRHASWSAFTPKVSISYQPNASQNLYVTVARGFKSGGFPAAPQREEDSRPLDQEKATSVEVGMKADFSSSFRLNVAAFRTEYQGLQIQSFGPIAGCVENPATPQIECFGAFETFNAGDAEAQGVEVELTWLPFDRLTLSGSYGLLDAKFKNAFVPNSAFPDQSGQDLIHAPRNKASVNAEYVQPVGRVGSIAASVGYNHTDEQRGELEPYAIQPAFDLLDARLAWTSPEKQFEVSLWGRNLADKAWVSHVYTVAGEVIGTFGDPRMYGVTFMWRQN